MVEEGEPVFVDVDCVTGSKVVDEEPKDVVEISMKLLYSLNAFYQKIDNSNKPVDLSIVVIFGHSALQYFGHFVL